MTEESFALYVARWGLEADGDPIETPTSWLLPVRWGVAPAMLKVFKPTSDEREGVPLLRYYAGDGAVRVIESDPDALLMERAAGRRCLLSMALSGGDREASAILASVVARLHAPRPSPMPSALTPLEMQFTSLFRRADQHVGLARAAQLARSLLATEANAGPLHGDLHHRNVLDGEARGWLAIDPKGLVGERTYDTANLFGNPWPHGKIVHDAVRMQRLAHDLAARLGLNRERVLAFALAHAGLSASWDMDDGCDPTFRLACIDVLQPLVDGSST